MKTTQKIAGVYIVTGFIESGKTTLIHSMLEDKGFSRGEKTLIISCEEGIEEYDEALLKDNNCTLVTMDDKDQWTEESLRRIDAQVQPERVIIEYNNMWTIDYMGKVEMPALWRVVQVITTVDATTFDNYMANVRTILTDPMKEADLVLFNRCTESMPKSQWRRAIRALNPNTNILFENKDGTSEDGIADEDLPYDMKAEIIDISDDQMGIFYIDSLDHPDRYDGKTVRFVGQPFPDKAIPEGYYYFGRLAMTCCANDIQQMGWVTQGNLKPSTRHFYRLTAKCHKMTGGDGQAILTFSEVSYEPAARPREKYITFN
ncbi:MAG: GTPase [Clostridia bacterium]|nr:GTPase [Clostridia bacterium]